MLSNHKTFALLIPHVLSITIHLKAYQFIVINVSIYSISENEFSLLNKSEVNSDTSKS